MIAGLSAQDMQGLRAILTEDVVSGAPDAVRPLLVRVRQALSKSAPAEARAELDSIAEELAQAPDLREGIASWLGGVAGSVDEAVEPVEHAAERVRDEAAKVGDAEAGLRERLDQLPDEQAAKVREALDALDAEGLTGDVLALLSRVGELGGGLSEALRGGLSQASRDGQPDAAAAALGSLQGLLQALGDDADGLTRRLQSLEAVAEALQQVAADQGRESQADAGQRAALLLQRAMQAEREAAQRGEAGPEDLWWAAFTTGEAAQDLQVVGEAGARLMAGAIDADDTEAFLDLARRRKAVAEAVGADRAVVVASIEEGRALTELGQHDAAEALMLKAVQRARRVGDERLVARARLASAGVLQGAGRRLEAEQELTRLLMDLQDLEGVEDVVAKAAMGLALTLNDVPDAQDRRTQALRVAASLGDKLADPSIYVPSKLGLVFAANEAGDRALAVQHLVRGRVRAQDFGEGPGQAFTDALLVLQEEWGENALAEALRAHRQG